MALQYASLPIEDLAAHHLLACADERAAKTVDELKAEYAAASGGLFGALIAKQSELSAKATRTVKSTTLNPARDAGSVVVAAAVPDVDGTTTESTVTVAVQAEGDSWCVVAGWAEQKRLAGIASEAEKLRSRWSPS